MEELLTLFNRFSRLVREAFHDDPRFLTSRDKVSRSLLSYMTVHCVVQLYCRGTQSESTRDRRVLSLAVCVTIATCCSLSQAYKQVVNDTSVFKLDLPSSRAK